MNVTHFVENLNRGGLERVVIDLAREQQRQGYRCQVVCLYEQGMLAMELDRSGVPVLACGKRTGVDLAALARARRAIRSHRTDVLHTHNAVAHYQGAFASMGAGVRRLVNTRHGMGGNARAARREWLYRRAMGRTDVVATVCEAARRDAVARGIVPERKACVVPNGIAVTAFPPRSEAMHGQLGRALGVPEHTRLIGHIGRHNWTKNQAGLIRAFARVHVEQPDCVLVLVGDGELRGELEHISHEAGVAGAVHFLGDRNDVPALLQGFDLFALPSVSEGYSIALLEACASALPIVATDVGGNGEIVRDGYTGRLVPAGDVDALAHTLLDLLRDPAQARTLGAAARSWVHGHGSLHAMVTHYDRLYSGNGARA